MFEEINIQGEMGKFFVLKCPAPTPKRLNLRAEIHQMAFFQRTYTVGRSLNIDCVSPTDIVHSRYGVFKGRSASASSSWETSPV